MNRNATPGSNRIAIPASSTTIAPAIELRTPNRLASTGASGANAPKHSTGSVVNADAQPDDNPVSRSIRPISGPMLAAAGRRLIATSTTPASRIHSDERGRQRVTPTPGSGEHAGDHV